MAESPSGKLRIWEGWVPSGPRAPARAVEAEFPAPLHPVALADRLAARECLRAPGWGREGPEPFTLQWFLDVEQARHGRRGRWIPRLLEFAKHRGERLLGLGLGLGTDWVQYARHGAEVVACCPSRDHLALVRRHFEVRGLRGAFLHANPVALPLETASIDVACVTGLLHEVADPRGVVGEVYRVLKPGGKVLVMVPARYDIEFWCRYCFPWHYWLRPRGPDPLCTWGEESAEGAFTARGLRQLFARFVEPRVHKRHLRRGDVPHLWRWLPLPLLERLLGRLLVFKGFKPLSAAMGEQAAA
jgi:SAM-dependent methyltransferase